MSVLRKDLIVRENNSIRGYFPARTQTANESDFDWTFAAAGIIRNLYRKEVKRKVYKAYSSELGLKSEFVNGLLKAECKTFIEERADDFGLWDVINDMYFCEGGINRVAPITKVALLDNESKSSPKRRLLDMFTSIMGGFNIAPENACFQSGNFLERVVQESVHSEAIFTEVRDFSDLMSTGVVEYPYLPWLSKLFVKDLEFLSRHQVYFNAFLEDFLRLYGYLYTAQLTLNISNLDTEPSVKPQFFIMENEKASRERVEIIDHGYKRVVENMHLLFPYLSISESLQDPKSSSDGRLRPLWWLAQRLNESDVPALKEYAKSFIEKRLDEYSAILELTETELSPKYWLKTILEASLAQFSKGNTKAAAQNRFIENVQKELCSHFVRKRGDRGNILVINQDYITLITNIVIGDKEKLRFSELIVGIEERGIFFDKQSQKALVEFYERMGNVERMSDSGDAVYVRKTI